MEIDTAPNSILVDKKVKRGQGKAAEKVTKRLRYFDSNESPAFKKISNLFHSGIVRLELKRIAEILSENLGLTLDRDAKRDKRVLIKWFDENWSVLSKEIDKITIYDSEFNAISG